MRFKAKLSRHQATTLQNIIGTSLSPRIAHDGICHLSPSHLRISVRGTGSPASRFGGATTAPSQSQSSTEGISAFVELDASLLFTDMRIQSAADDNIVFAVNISQWRGALASVASAAPGGRKRPRGGGPDISNGGGEIVMKLAKRAGDSPCLVIESAAAVGYAGVDVSQAIPVAIMRAEEMARHVPPALGEADVQVEISGGGEGGGRSLPPLPMKVVVDRMRGFGQHVLLEATTAGDLTLRVDSPGTSVRTYYSGLTPQFSSDVLPVPHGSVNKCLLQIDGRKLSAAFGWQAGPLAIGKGYTAACVLCMMKNEMLVCHVMLDPIEMGFFTYYVPVCYIDEETMAAGI